MVGHLTAGAARGAIPILALAKEDLAGWLDAQSAPVRRWVAAAGFTSEAGSRCLVPDAGGGLGRVLLGVGEDAVWDWARLPTALPEGHYRVDGAPAPAAGARAALGWALGAYSFERYRARPRGAATLIWPRGIDRAAVERTVAATYLVRDLVNTPAVDMGPAELAAAARRLAREHGASIKVVAGDALIKAGYPMVHAVGRASARAPRLIDLAWGRPRDPRVTVVGKGVCFDSGGLDLKGSSGMKLMKKDMGGAAHALGLAHMIMAAALPVRLRVLVPAVENAVAGNALRPLDVLVSRKGLTVEVGNTDAEGRLVLADALAEASRERPALLIDFATLTGAARVALGPDLPALYCNDDGLAAELIEHGLGEGDPLWRMPLWRPYRLKLDSNLADLNSAPDWPMAGSITAALFLESFVDAGVSWAHVDLYAWNQSARPGRPEGGEAMSMRAFFALIRARFGG